MVPCTPFAALLDPPAMAAEAPHADLLSLTVTELAAGIRERRLSSRELTDACLDRMDKLDQRHTLNAFLLSAGDAARAEAGRTPADVLTELGPDVGAVMAAEVGPQATPVPAHAHARAVDTFATFIRYTFCVSVAGLPAISVPDGRSAEGLPIGVQFIGPSWSEPLLIRTAHAVEQLTTRRGRARPSGRTRRPGCAQ